MIAARLRSQLEDERGISLIEVMVSMLILTIGVLGMSMLLYTSGQQLQRAHRDVQLWSAVHQKMEELSAQGYGSVSAGTDTVHGYPLSWTVTNESDTDRIVLVAESKIDAPPAPPDSFVTYLRNPNP